MNTIIDVIQSCGVTLSKGPGTVLWSGTCPFHKDSVGCLRVSPSKDFFFCMGCGSGGNSDDFVKQYKEQVTTT